MQEQLTVKYPGASIYTLVCLSKLDHVVIYKKDVSLREVLEDVCNILGEDIKRVVSNNRERRLVYCRHIYCVVARRLTFCGLLKIGEQIGNRDHTTILHSINTARVLFEGGNFEFTDMWDNYISKTTLFKSANGEAVRDVPHDLIIKPQPNRKIKMTEKDVTDAVRMLKRGYDKKTIQRKYHVHIDTLNKKIRKYKSQMI